MRHILRLAGLLATAKLPYRQLAPAEPGAHPRTVSIPPLPLFPIFSFLLREELSYLAESHVFRAHPRHLIHPANLCRGAPPCSFGSSEDSSDGTCRQ